jgi:hypothetical protein
MANLKAKPELRAVTIALVRNRKEAERVQDKLRAAGVESALAAESSYAMDKGTSRERRAVKIQVRRSDVQRALIILGGANMATTTTAANASETPRASRWLTAGNPIVATVATLSVIIAALVLFLT